MILPDCMMPDGAEPCKAFLEIQAENTRLRAALAQSKSPELGARLELEEAKKLIKRLALMDCFIGPIWDEVEI